MESEHCQQLVNLYCIKTRYNAMVLDQGRENVDQKLLISEVQSWRKRYVDYGPEFFDAADFERLDTITPSFTSGIDSLARTPTRTLATTPLRTPARTPARTPGTPKVDDTMLY